MPYDSSTGSSGPAHQACEYGLPIVCADIADFRCMANDDDMAIKFYRLGDAADLADNIVSILKSPEIQEQMSVHNYEAGVQMMMANVARNYLRWFQLHKIKREMKRSGAIRRMGQRLRIPWPPIGRESIASLRSKHAEQEKISLGPTLIFRNGNPGRPAAPSTPPNLSLSGGVEENPEQAL